MPHRIALFREQIAAHVAQALGRRRVRTLLEAVEAPPREVKPLGEARYYGEMISSLQGGTLSFESVMLAVQSLLTEYHRQQHPSSSQAPCSYDCTYRGVATFPGSVVYECLGKLYQVDFRVEGTTALIVGTPKEVTATFVPAPGEAVSEAVRTMLAARGAAAPAVTAQESATLLVEATPAATLRGSANIDRDAGVIRNVVFITSESRNGVNGRRVYTDPALDQIVRLCEGLPCYLNHVAPADAFKPRAVQELAGKHVNLRREPGTRRILSDLEVLEHQRPMVFALAESLGDVVGNSLVSRSLVRLHEGVEFVDQVVQVRSGDLVSNPGATRGLFESMQDWQRAHPTPALSADPTTVQEDASMTTAAVAVITLAAILEHLQANAKDKDTLLKLAYGDVIAGHERALSEALGKVKPLEEQVAKLTTDLKESAAKVEGFQAKEAVVAKRGRLTTALEAHDLHKRYGKTAGVISEAWLTSCMEAAEDAWKGLMDDKLAGLDAVLKGRPTVAPRSDRPEAIQEGAHADLSRDERVGKFSEAMARV